MKAKKMFKILGPIILMVVAIPYWKLILHNLILLGIVFWIVRGILRLVRRLLPLCVAGYIVYLLFIY